MEVRYEEVGECIELYINGEYIRLFNAFPTCFENQLDAEAYVKNEYFTKQKS